MTGTSGCGRGVVTAALVLALSRSGAVADGPDALTIRAVGTAEQGGQLLGLFRGARAPDPAAALAAWKHATGGKGTLGKPLEAAIAVLNPAMVAELNGLDGAEVAVGFATGTGKTVWRAVVPRDDGSFAALATALALTDGATEEPVGGVPVLRLGAPGSAVSARRPDRLVLASSRDGIRAGLDQPTEVEAGQPGWYARLDPVGLRGLTSVAGRRLAEGLGVAGCREVRGWLSLSDETLTLRVESTLEQTRGAAPAVVGTWLDGIPARGTLAAVSVALDTRPESLDAGFAVLDRLEKVDPARAGVAPIRIRLNLLASAVRVRPEADLWPLVKGVTAAVLADGGGEWISGAVVVLHAVDPEAAGRLVEVVLPRLASAIARGEKPDVPAPEAIRTLGMIDGKPVRGARRGADVVIGWGEGAIDSALEARERPERSAGKAVRAAWKGSPPNRTGAFWPGRVKRIAPTGSPLALALDAAPPLVWEGRTEGKAAHDVVRWGGLRGVVKRWLDALPLDPPPDRGDTRELNTPMSRPPRLIDLRCHWVTQYARETTLFDPALYPGMDGRWCQLDGYLQGTAASVIVCGRTAEDWAGRADPWAALGDLIARVEAEFPGRILIGPDDYARWVEEPDGLCWAVIGVGGFDALVRSAADLDRLPGLFERGVRVFQPVSSASSVWAGDDRGLSELGRAFLETLAGLSTGPTPLLDLANMGVSVASDVVSWFERDKTRAGRLLPVSSRGPRHKNLAGLRAIGGVVGFGLGGPGVRSAEALKESIVATAELPYQGRPGYEGVAIGTDFNGTEGVLPGLSTVGEVTAWVVANFDAEVAAAILEGNARTLLARALGAPGSVPDQTA